MNMVEFPDMRHEVIAAVRSLSDAEHQRRQWGKVEAGVNYYDDLSLTVHVLYDDCQVLPTPEAAVPAVLYPGEVVAFRGLDSALGPLIADLGDRPDDDYLADPRWGSVVEAAGAALRLMEASER